jgi:hypothetical protein
MGIRGPIGKGGRKDAVKKKKKRPVKEEKKK